MSGEPSHKSDTELPRHVEETVRAVEELHVQHRKEASLADRILDYAKERISRPRFLGLVLIVVFVWMLANTALPSSLRIDPPPFLNLATALAISAVCLTILILSTQWRADRLAEHREKLILQLTFVSEQKTAKLIALLEELRRDLPQVRNRPDQEAEQMIEAVDVAAVSQALREGETANVTNGLESDKEKPRQLSPTGPGERFGGDCEHSPQGNGSIAGRFRRN